MDLKFCTICFKTYFYWLIKCFTFTYLDFIDLVTGFNILYHFIRNVDVLIKYECTNMIQFLV